MLKAYGNYQHRRQDDPVVAGDPLFHTRTGGNKRSADLVSMCCISLLAPQGALYFVVHHYKFPGSRPPLNHAYPRAFDARASFLNDARIPAQDSRALNAYFTRI